nr:uncharacterized protein LOC131799823 [Pocillopora verrucosa]
MVKNIKKDVKDDLYDEPGVVGSLGGVAPYAKAQKISIAQGKKELEEKLAYTLHKPRRRRGEFLPVVVFDIDQQWVADLIEVQTLSKQNKGYRYVLVVIDAFSKYAWARPIKKKPGKDVTDAFAKILKEAKGRKPQTLQTDAGKEFYNQTFQSLMKTQEIHHFSTHGDAKANILPKLVNEYNRTYHRSIKTTPAKVTTFNAKEVWNNLYGKYQTKKEKKPAFKVGDKVRLNKKFRPFEKGYLPGWTEEVFQVRKVVPGMVTTYKVQELDDTPLQGTFYVWDLEKVHVDEATYFRVEKVLKRQKDKLFVKWKGYPSKYNSWINKKDLK